VAPVGKTSTDAVAQAQRPLLVAVVDRPADETPAESLPPPAGKTEAPVPESKTESAKPQPPAAEAKTPAPEPARPAEPPDTALQEIRGPKADDNLVDLLQKEIEQAIEQPSGRRKIQFSMPLVENERVRYFIDAFCGKLRDFFSRALARSGKYIPMMASVLQEAGLPEDLVYLSLIESGFAPSAYSKAKAVGPWQFIHATGVRYGLRIDAWVDERRDPVKSTRAAAAYLKDLHGQFGEWFLAAAAYNAGEGRVENALQRTNTSDYWDLTGRTVLKQETRNYVPKFIAAALIAGEPEKYGFNDLVYEAPVDYDEVTTKRPLALTTAAHMAHTTVTNLKELNPALLKNVTPPSEEGFTLRVPSGSGELFNQAYAAQYASSADIKVINYTVKRGETLAAIARRYHVRPSQIIETNELKTGALRTGQQLTIIHDGSAPAPEPVKEQKAVAHPSVTKKAAVRPSTTQKTAPKSSGHPTKTKSKTKTSETAARR
jgi:membrane-bound lytic murein transglycosylase D